MEIVKIDKKVLISEFEEYEKDSQDEGDYYNARVFHNIVEFLNDIPTIQIEVHGKWNNKYRSGYKPPNVFVCSYCNRCNYEKSDFCPNCGAMMDNMGEGE